MKQTGHHSNRSKMSSILLLQLGLLFLSSSAKQFLKANENLAEQTIGKSFLGDDESDQNDFFGELKEGSASNKLNINKSPSELSSLLGSDTFFSHNLQQAVTGNIVTEIPFSKTVYQSYASAVQTGLALKWTSTAVCFQSSYKFLDDLFYIHQNITGYDVTVAGVTTFKDNEDRQVEMVAFNISNVVSRNFASMFYNCYVMIQSGIDQTNVWFNSFLDFTDVYTSFLF